ncbi:TA system antitoxin ParD family protein [Candidatus Poriferisodalis sp.]|uniref:TA system antitoxin ParD family protein n=1 Tax=Candidatus Poriferisodalis sp. TaxID=3101277 RepID=UPI003B0123D6
MATSTPIRVDEDIHALATALAPLMSRSAAQQVSHWARIGKELESAPNVSTQAIEQVLGCRASYDDLNEREQAVVRAEWAERTDQRRRDLNLADEFAAEGRSYVELDDDGNIVTRQP